MKVVLALFFAVILLVGVIPYADAKDSKKTSTKDKLEAKANQLEQKINRLLSTCDNAGITVSYAYCFSKGYTYWKDRLYKYVDEGQKLNFEHKMYYWSKQIKI